MKEKDLIRLMNDQLDGVATPEDSERLKRHLAESAEARTRFRELGDVFASLNRVEMVDPPSDLRQNVMRSIRRRAHSAQARDGWLELIWAAFRRRPALQYAYSFAAGAGVAALLIALVTGGVLSRFSRTESPFTGTMLPPAGLGGFERLDGREYLLPGGRVTVETYRSSEGLVARVDAAGPAGTRIGVSYDTASLAAVALRQSRSGASKVALGGGRLEITIGQPGEQQYLLYLARIRPGSSPVRVDVLSGAETYHGELRAGIAGSGR